MRPHLLKFGGIGAYGGDVEISFDDLSKQGLYLIVGPTGAGKTTIFDAMTYALFGATASERESMFVSDHDGRVDPYVEFTFSHQGRRFIIHRTPAKEQGKTPPPSKQWFREIDDRGDELRTETGTNTINPSVKELLGLDANQFMKVVLLPQGKFQEFLMAKSTDRRPLLQKIFGTGLYAIVAMRLKEAAAELEQAAERARIALESERGTARSVIESLDDEVRVDLPDPDHDLDGVIEKLGVISGERNKSATAAGDLLMAAVSAETSAQTDAERFKAKQELNDLEPIQNVEQKKAATAEGSIDAHRRAERVVAADNAAVEAKKQADESETAVTEARKELTRVVKDLTISPEETSTLEGALSSASPTALAGEIDKLIRKVEDTLSAHTDLLEAKGDEKSALDEIGRIEKDTGRLKADKEKKSKELETAKKKHKESNDAAKKYPTLEARISKIDDTRKDADVEGAQQALVDADDKLKAAQKTLKAADEKLEKARNDRTLHLAGELAANLIKGEECPVCGSVEHPRKAKKTSETDVGKLEKARDKAYGTVMSIEADVSARQTAVETALTNKAKLPTAAEEKKLRQEFEKISELAGLLEEREEYVEALEEAITELTDFLSELAAKAAAHKSSLTGAQKKITKLEPRASALGAIAVVEKAQTLLEEGKEQVKVLEAAVVRATTAKGTAESTKQNLGVVLTTEGFKTVDSARAAVLEDQQVSSLKDLIKAVNDRAERIATLKGLVGSDPVPKEMPDLEVLEAARQRAEEALRLASDSASTLASAIRQLETAQSNIAALGPKVDAEVEQARKAKAIAGVVHAGVGAGNDRQLGLEEWVQRTLFEEVCEVATDQLLRLSNNRYVLTLDAEDARMKKKAGGLELYVIDSQNGKRRSVHTLSGGEQFLTSLALALALAEVVERHAGGMELSALFIDEGFGSLDGETLDAAIDVLLKLHDTGRTVGVITHVEAMQQQLPIGIRITKTNKGSSLEVLASA